MKEAALVNAYILYMAHHPTSKMKAAEFRRQVAEKLCDSVPKNKFHNRGRHSNEPLEETESRLKERHFPMQFENPRTYRPNCVVCSNSTSHQSRRQTNFGCMQCKDDKGKNIAMCVPDCFNKYHTVKYFRR